MPQFQFQLQMLLDFRVRKEDELKRHLGELERVVQREQAALIELERGLKEAVGCYDEPGPDDVDLDRARLFRSFYAQLSSRIDDKQQKISELEEEMKHQRDQVVEAMKERKIVQTLHDKQFEQFRINELRREQATLDDIATSRHVCGQLNQNPETA